MFSPLIWFVVCFFVILITSVIYIDVISQFMWIDGILIFKNLDEIWSYFSDGLASMVGNEYILITLMTVIFMAFVILVLGALLNFVFDQLKDIDP
jgi:ABC-type phosphate/phosphonate transport system permease subunit